MLPESNPKKSCRGSHHALRLHRNLLQSQAPPLSARLSLPTRVRKTLEQSNKPTKLNNCLSAFSKTDQFLHKALFTYDLIDSSKRHPVHPWRSIVGPYLPVSCHQRLLVDDLVIQTVEAKSLLL